MKVSCEIIKDLLPLYHDGVCSKDSQLMIEEHLTDCEECKAELQAMEKEFLVDSKEKNLSEAMAVEKLSKRWKKGMMKSLLSGVFSTTVFFIIVILLLFIFVDIRIV